MNKTFDRLKFSLLCRIEPLSITYSSSIRYPWVARTLLLDVSLSADHTPRQNSKPARQSYFILRGTLSQPPEVSQPVGLRQSLTNKIASRPGQPHLQ